MCPVSTLHRLQLQSLTDSTKGRLKRWGAKTEELASLRFDVKTNLNPILHSYNTKQLFIYLTASYDEVHAGSVSNMTVGEHEVVLWDRIITRSDMKDLRAVGQKVKTSGGPKRGRGNVRVEEGKTKYQWRNPSGTFR
jgi:signal peptidase complex subunit 3